MRQYQSLTKATDLTYDIISECVASSELKENVECVFYDAQAGGLDSSQTMHYDSDKWYDLVGCSTPLVLWS